MKTPVLDHVIGIPVTPLAYRAEESSSVPSTPYIFAFPSYGSSPSKQNKIDSIIGWMNKFTKKADTLANGVREHVRMGPKISETVMGKLSLGARILQGGGVEKLYTQIFRVGEEEKLLKACQCYLSTTAGPIAGLLFISTLRIAFCSDRHLTLASVDGKSIKTHYKVSIPLKKIERASRSQNANKPTQKYIQIVSVDKFEFWFMAFVNYQKAFKSLQEVVSLPSNPFSQ